MENPKIERFFYDLNIAIDSIPIPFLLTYLLLAFGIALESLGRGYLNLFQVAGAFIMISFLILLFAYLKYKHKSKKIESFLNTQRWYLSLGYDWILSLPYKSLKGKKLDEHLSRYYIRFEYSVKGTDQIVSIQANIDEDPSQIYNWIIGLKSNHSQNKYDLIVDKIELGRLSHAIYRAKIFINYRKEYREMNCEDIIKLYKDIADH